MLSNPRELTSNFTTSPFNPYHFLSSHPPDFDPTKANPVLHISTSGRRPFKKHSTTSHSLSFISNSLSPIGLLSIVPSEIRMAQAARRTNSLSVLAIACSIYPPLGPISSILRLLELSRESVRQPDSEFPSPVIAAFQVQCASSSRWNMFGVQFPFLALEELPDVQSAPHQLKPLGLMTEEEMMANINVAIAEDERREERDLNHPNAHVGIWNRREKRKIAGNAAPLRRNLDRYFSSHPDCEVYTNQGKPPGWKPKKKIARRNRMVKTMLAEVKRRAGLALAEAQRQARAGSSTQKKTVNTAQAGSGNGYCSSCWKTEYKQANGASAQRLREYCGSYKCRMLRCGVDGKLHPYLVGHVSPPVGVRSEFELAEVSPSAVSEYNDLFDTAGKEIFARFVHNDDLHVDSLPSLPRSFEEIVIE